MYECVMYYVIMLYRVIRVCFYIQIQEKEKSPPSISPNRKKNLLTLALKIMLYV